MKNGYRSPSLKHAALVSLLSILFFSVLFIIMQSCVGSSFCAWLAAYSDPSNAFSQLDISYDSRIFLQPLQYILQAFLSLFPFFQTGNHAAIFLTILFSALTSGMIIIAAQYAGLRVEIGWIMAALYLFNPIVVRSTLSASGVSIPIFFITFIFVYLITWQNYRFWLALVWIGLGAALVVLAQFSTLFYLILPVFAALVIAYLEKPHNVYYTENALWILLTPLLYVFFVRFFFGYALEGDLFAFSQFENSPLQTEIIKQAFDLPVLPRIALFVRENITFLWLSNPVFILFSVATIITATIKRKIFPVIYTLIIWLPILLLRSGRQSGVYDPLWITANLLVLSSFLMVVISAQLWKKNRWIFLAPSLLLLAAYTSLQWASIR